jgi:hypothetical protein
MTVKELERRVEALEKEVRRLNESLHTQNNGDKSLLAAVEKFAGDEGLLNVIAAGQKLREQDRQRARNRAVKGRKPRS